MEEQKLHSEKKLVRKMLQIFLQIVVVAESVATNEYLNWVCT